MKVVMAVLVRRVPPPAAEGSACLLRFETSACLIVERGASSADGQARTVYVARRKKDPSAASCVDADPSEKNVFSEILAASRRSVKIHSFAVDDSSYDDGHDAGMVHKLAALAEVDLAVYVQPLSFVSRSEC